MKLIQSSIIALLSILPFASCNCDHEPEMPFKVGWVVCTDSDVMPICEFIRSGKEAVAMVYYVNPDYEAEIAGYAVYLEDIDPVAFAEELAIEQNTSTDIYALDGNENTYAMYSTEDVESPLARKVFDMWTFNQSAYIPSVNQLAQIKAVKGILNERMPMIGGTILPDEPTECWYWSSTEVNGQQDSKAWLFSMQSGARLETPKNQAHKARPVITLYRTPLKN